MSEGLDVIAYVVPRLFPLSNSLANFKLFAKMALRGVKFVEYIDPFEFLWLVKNAKYVITNSYHGTIFSIIFKKPFVTIPFRGRSSRMLDLLDLLNLRHRIANTSSEILRKLEDDIDFGEAERLIEFHKRRSLELLMSALSNERV